MEGEVKGMVLVPDHAEVVHDLPEDLSEHASPSAVIEDRPLTSEEKVALLTDEEHRQNFEACLKVGDCLALHVREELTASGKFAVGQADMLILRAMTDFTAEVAEAYGIPGYKKQEKRRIILPH